jgi:hypothetical protein
LPAATAALSLLCPSISPSSSLMASLIDPPIVLAPSSPGYIRPGPLRRGRWDDSDRFLSQTEASYQCRGPSPSHPDETCLDSSFLESKEVRGGFSGFNHKREVKSPAHLTVCLAEVRS